MLQHQEIVSHVTLLKFVHGGQCLAEYTDGRKMFVWGGLPGEQVTVRIVHKRASFIEAIVRSVEVAHPDRIDPTEPDTYLSTSPWQILSFAAENRAKQDILQETFQRANIPAEFEPFISDSQLYQYRNKLELGFYGDDEGLHYAQFVRGSHQKHIIRNNQLAIPSIMHAANTCLDMLRNDAQQSGLRAGELKSIMFRCDQSGNVVGALFVKSPIPHLHISLPPNMKGLVVYYSNPKSPASVATKELYSYGDITLQDTVRGKNITYDVLSFFQVNLPVFTRTLSAVTPYVHASSDIIDFYSGVGTIGIALGATSLVETDDRNVAFARHNAGSHNITVIHAAAEHATQYIQPQQTVIVDPPRAGLHPRVIARLREVRPKRVVYLSCNPITQARDIALLDTRYRVTYAQGFNYFPRTPHIESLVVLE